MKGSGIDSATPTYRWNGADVNAGWVTTFNEYCVVSENRVTPVPSDVPGDAACLLGCAATTGLGIVFNDAKLRPGQSIAVFGAGGVGLNVIQGAALVSAFPIVAVDLHDDKLERSSGFGATHTVNMGREGAVDTLTEIVGTRGYDVAVDTTGNPRVFETAYRLTAPRGTTVLAGVLPEAGGSVTLDPFPLHFGRRIVGSHGGDTDPDTDIPRYVDLYRRGKLKLNEQITHRFPLSRINEATESLQHGAQVGRCVISMES
jgi:S-(hydroxymethyl)glutathione dehydrogenase/alcohol dehydrogenase